MTAGRSAIRLSSAHVSANAAVWRTGRMLRAPASITVSPRPRMIRLGRGGRNGPTDSAVSFTRTWSSRGSGDPGRRTGYDPVVEPPQVSSEQVEHRLGTGVDVDPVHRPRTRPARRSWYGDLPLPLPHGVLDPCRAQSKSVERSRGPPAPARGGRVHDPASTTALGGVLRGKRNATTKAFQTERSNANAAVIRSSTLLGA